MKPRHTTKGHRASLVRRWEFAFFVPSTGLRRAALEGVVVATTLIVLQAVVFFRYYNGTATPTWDFGGGYTTEAYAWWHDGSFFKPTDWLPYLWGGYPSVANLQNSSWYIPVGIVSAITEYDQQAAAVLSALHVGFGALGVYATARFWKMRPSSALVGMVIWFFAAGFYSNASHLDIMHSYAWIPWVLLCASPCWPWTRWWAPLVATLIFWQAILGIYPGIMIAGAYVGAFWVATNQFLGRPKLRRYLVPLMLSLALAGMLALLRFIPSYLTEGTSAHSHPASSVWDWQLFGTFFYSYADPRLPGDITMRSFFLPVPAFAALAFVNWRESMAKVALVTGFLAVFLGLPSLPWQHFVSSLPGLDVSRFRMSDFKVFFLFAVCLLAVAAVNNVITGRHELTPSRMTQERSASTKRIITPARGIYLVFLLAGAGVTGLIGPFTEQDRYFQWGLLAVAAAIMVIAGKPLIRMQLGIFVAILALLSVTSGLIWAFTSQNPWSVPRVENEYRMYGRPVAELIASRAPVEVLTQRPARHDSNRAGIAKNNFRGVAAFYDGTLGISGYSTLKGAPTWERIYTSLRNPSTNTDSYAFWLAPGFAIATDKGEIPKSRNSVRCATVNNCGFTAFTAESYSAKPDYVYRVATEKPIEISFNEAYYPGWVITACSRVHEGRCIDVPVRSGVGGQLVATKVPAGDWRLELTYRLPGKGLSWLVFVGATLALLAWTALLILHPSKSKSVRQ